MALDEHHAPVIRARVARRSLSEVDCISQSITAYQTRITCYGERGRSPGERGGCPEEKIGTFTGLDCCVEGAVAMIMVCEKRGILGESRSAVLQETPVSDINLIGR